MRKFVIREASRRSVYIWNMAGSLINAVRTVVVLALVSRLAGNEAAGIFSLGFSTAQMFYTVAHFETRNVVVVDRGKTFQQDTIVSFRVLTISAMIAASLVFLAFAGFDRQTTTVTALLCLYMAILAIAELSEALFHMFGHLELAGKSLTFDILLGTVFFTLIIWWKQDIAAATIGMTTATVAWIFLYDVPYLRALTQIRFSFRRESLMRLLTLSGPLFCMTFLSSYIFNAPKFAIEEHLSAVEQSYYGFMFTLAACVNLVTSFALRPQLQPLAKAWDEKDRFKFGRLTRNLSLWLIGAGVCIVVGGWLLGIPVLSVLYGADLSGCRTELTIMLVGGVLYAFCALFSALATVMRIQRHFLLVYAAVALLSLFVPGWMVLRFELMGAVLSYTVLMLALTVLGGVLLRMKQKAWFS